MVKTNKKPVNMADIRRMYSMPKNKIATQGIDAADPGWRNVW